ncbi:LysR substrate-binding domain-containing protein [uncultured Ilumatobacter sp.]|uniref:LysR substrate-binding domain-containing protein n=1 Tax=uncultured Ilumatobacter sp. TaxID=879968 RepID=UPI00374FC0AF
MALRPRLLVSSIDRLQRLAVFDAAARNGSFSAAGRELGLAQPAVTRQIQGLEQSLGIELFVRHANRSTLSGPGHALAAAVDNAFTLLEHAVGDITDVDDIFVLAMPPGFAQQLVVPRLDSLQRALENRDLRLWLYDRESELSHSHFDAAVRVSNAAWSGYDATPLFAEQVMPVATPALAAQLNLDQDSSAKDVLAAPLLHMDATDRPWMSWTDWLQSFDLSLTPSRRRVEFNNYPTVLQQALAGRGVALGWSKLVEDLVADNLLCIVGPVATSDRDYQLTWPTRRAGAALSALRGWLYELVNE